jgi:hypothetical protein
MFSVEVIYIHYVICWIFNSMLESFIYFMSCVRNIILFLSHMLNPHVCCIASQYAVGCILGC